MLTDRQTPGPQRMIVFEDMIVAEFIGWGRGVLEVFEPLLCDNWCPKEGLRCVQRSSHMKAGAALPQSRVVLEPRPGADPLFLRGSMLPSAP